MFTILAKAFILVFELTWIAIIVHRLPKDIREFIYTEERLDRVALVVLWLITLALIYHAARFCWYLIKPTLSYF